MSIATGTTYQAIVGQVIVKMRNQLGLNQEAMARKVSMSQSAWSRVEKGDSNINLEQLVKVSKALNTDPHYLIAEADRVKHELELNKIQVADNKNDADATGLLLLGAAAIAALIILGKNK